MSNTALLVIDAQREYGPGGGLEIAGITETNTRLSKLIAGARGAGSLVVFIRHVSRNPNDSTFNAGTAGVEFLPDITPAAEDPVITKQYPGAFTETSLDRLLRAHGITTVVVAGYTSFLCCDSTARQAFELGYKVVYVEDAISEFALDGFSQADLHKTVNAVQGAMFSDVLTVDQALPRLAS